MAGSISISLDQLLNNLSAPLAGGFIYFIQAGTTSTPQNAYQDDLLTIPHPNPLELNSVGFVPQLYFADGFIKIRITDSAGVTVINQDNILVVGPSSGSGGVAVDATTVFSAGDVKWRYGTGAHTGWVRGAGRTIGSATSGATERANADCQTLFEYLWTTDTTTLFLAVSGGRGASAAADWAANKTLTLPDARGRTVGALGDMGNSATSVLTSTYYGADPTNLGQVGGAQSRTVAQANLPSVNFSVSATGTGQTQSIGGNNFTSTDGSTTGATGGASYVVPINTGLNVLNVTSVSVTGTAASGGSGTALSDVMPTILMTLYFKL